MTSPAYREYDHIVIGGGAFGSAACYWLSARPGSRVLGLEQYELGHRRGSSGDSSRYIRPYHRDRRYSQLLPAAYDAWRSVQSTWQTAPILFTIGGLEIGDGSAAGQQMITDLAAALERDSIPFESPSPAQVHARWPQFRMYGDEQCIYQGDAGFVDPRHAIRAHAEIARDRGATILAETPVTKIEHDSGRWVITTPAGEFRSPRIILTAGAWTQRLLDQLGYPLAITVTEEQVTYFGARTLSDFALDRMPTFTFRSDEPMLYGGPDYAGFGVKITQEIMKHTVAPETRSHQLDLGVVQTCKAFLSQRLPGVDGPMISGRTCLYAGPVDRDLIIDHVPGAPGALMAIGGGVGFKYSSLVGRLLTNLAHDETPQVDISGFGLARESLRTPGHGFGSICVWLSSAAF
ncbi:FAD-dependent oxidoreductase [Leekyejoonella antrihumi]|uniref:FAD-dependent oxidoreductase n=1 Tax=Leekyejoonella antrihumi TaxID=1660198 RepID=A0A563DW53_9MICO|nr:FAD-dependent oxidoreductase [Leekyejoonella antrihumi]TWP34436.1 FAD-dependent oxidoreductase [Leekyejoonella antrihumi]